MPAPRLGVFQGSKKAGRIFSVEQRNLDKVKKKIRKVRLLSQRLGSRYELDAYLTQIGDLELREAIRTMILAFRPEFKR